MIGNEQEYRITMAEAERFAHALAHADEQGAHLTHACGRPCARASRASCRNCVSS